MKILISGATGLVGMALTRTLRAEGHAVFHLVRPGAGLGADDVRWDPATGRADLTAMEGAHVVICLNGASIAGGRWTKERKKELWESRLLPTRLLVAAFKDLKQKPRVFIVASAIGYYGDRGDEVLTEASHMGKDFVAQLCRAWEAEAMLAESAGVRTCSLRFGIVLSTRGGALARMLLPFKLGLGGRLGSGRQWVSWISLEDVVGIVRFVTEKETFSGPVNIVAPRPVQNSEFTKILSSILHRPAIFPAPAFLLRLALGEMADGLLLASQRVEPERLVAAGYPFRFNHIEPALRAAILNKL
jgi:uncharacterized protein